MGGGGIVASFSLIGEKTRVTVAWFMATLHGYTSSVLCWFFYKDTFLVAATDFIVVDNSS